VRQTLADHIDPASRTGTRRGCRTHPCMAVPSSSQANPQEKHPPVKSQSRQKAIRARLASSHIDEALRSGLRTLIALPATRQVTKKFCLKYGVCTACLSAAAERRSPRRPRLSLPESPATPAQPSRRSSGFGCVRSELSGAGWMIMVTSSPLGRNAASVGRMIAS
jgi:hypothetical protein